ncbi:hypothetical protein V502_09831 [Pseudogymnoascus sp. VKM F-4520 (FW-2644)]|nr:hypothetical protein V502_09831 [Pseudogymnoascus sp. VKM F-4520 (FW-2644)]
MSSWAQQASPDANAVSQGYTNMKTARPPAPTKAFHGCSRIQDYEILRKLGEGTFGEVHQAKSRKTGAIVALKKILMHNEKDGFPITALREIKLLKLLDHINILRLEEMAVEHSQKSTDKRKRAIMYMVTPYMDHDLSGLLENPGVTFSIPQIKCYMMQLLKGTAYLHDNHILHRDMKAANLLINNKGILQIADFGLARHYEGPVPQPGGGGGEAVRDYTTLVVTRWYRPPELLLQLRRYTPAIDLWGVGCVFGEMLVGRPILSGESDARQLEIIFELVGSPTEESMPGWRALPGAQGLQPPHKGPTIAQRFKEYGPGAISLLTDLLKLDWRKRLNAIDGLKHHYFTENPLPANPGDLPTFEESHELDRRSRGGPKQGLPPAPRGYAVGGEPANAGNRPYGNGDNYGGMNRSHQNGAPHHNPGYGAPRNQPHPNDRRPGWSHARPDSRLPPRDYPPSSQTWGGGVDGSRSDRPHEYRDRDRDRDRDHLPSRARGGGSAGIAGRDVDTYIPSYGPDSGRRDERLRDDRPPRDDRLPRDDRRRWDERDDRRHPPHRERLDYDDRARNGRTRSRSRSPLRDRDRERVRDRESLDREVYRR